MLGKNAGDQHRLDEYTVWLHNPCFPGCLRARTARRRLSDGPAGAAEGILTRRLSVWSLAAIAHAAATSALSFGIARLFLGLGEAANFPACIKTVAEWLPKKERALATGIFNARHKHWSCRRPAHGALAHSHIWLADGLHRYRRARVHPAHFLGLHISPSGPRPSSPPQNSPISRAILRILTSVSAGPCASA